MISKKDNLFYVLAASIARGALTERYLLAGQTFETVFPTDETDRVLGIACSVCPGPALTPRDALVAHYHTLPAANNDVTFLNGAAKAVIDVDGVAIDVRIKLVSDNPPVYRVLFSRINATELYTSVQDEVTDLRQQVTKLTTRLDQLKPGLPGTPD